MYMVNFSLLIIVATMLLHPQLGWIPFIPTHTPALASLAQCLLRPNQLHGLSYGVLVEIRSTEYLHRASFLGAG
ncbi:unnamed protein product [Protopolystoma xenopodis]|uniref:Secreted protein n=1 Tax=Protopolystoma xenopodis TaxID=117903 RepID=A0A448XFU7_9PLAT|nr:unnamed protein product [Protopolystoma xenopodis]